MFPEYIELKHLLFHYSAVQALYSLNCGMSQSPVIHAEFSLAAQYVSQTDRSLFVTGKAGTGKTTFLRYIRENCPKKMAVVAPTGVAAMNAGGTTLHSFFQLPFGTYIADYRPDWGQSGPEVNNRHSLLKNLRLNSEKRDTIRELELLVIDEVSMLRADLFDAIDTVLRYVREKEQLPFGGVQLLLIGDLYQLPPVVNREEWQIMHSYYRSPFFFDALCLQQYPLLSIELKTVFRQSDDTFIRVLNNIRNNCATAADMAVLEEHYLPGFSPEPGYILLTSHNANADLINRSELEKLEAPAHSFEASIKGDFNERNVPVDRQMILKEGAQVMFVKNDKGENRRYYNGKIVTVSRISSGKVYVWLDEKTELELEKEVWRNISYHYDRDKDEIEEEELGSFTQFPVRLAWAITIHKSQGLTFEKAIVDAGKSFAAGQVYVALSRLRSLDGLVLRTKIHPDLVMTDERVVAFCNRLTDTRVLKDSLAQEQKRYACRRLQQIFDLEKLFEQVQVICRTFGKSNLPDRETETEKVMNWFEVLSRERSVAAKFQAQIQQLLENSSGPDYAFLYQRTMAAAQYFLPVLKKISREIQEQRDAYKVKPRSKKYVQLLRAGDLLLSRKIFDMEQAMSLAQGLAKGLDAGSLLADIASDKKQFEQTQSAIEEESGIAKTKDATPSRNISLDMFQRGMSVEEIAETRSMTVTTIEGHLSSFIATGEVSVSAFVDKEELSELLRRIAAQPGISASQLKSELPERYTYGKIRAVMSYHAHISTHG